MKCVLSDHRRVGKKDYRCRMKDESGRYFGMAYYFCEGNSGPLYVRLDKEPYVCAD